jgi:hypothetical protein
MNDRLLKDILLKDDFNSVVNNIKKHKNVITYKSAIEFWSKGYNIYCYVETHGYTYIFKGKENILFDYFYRIGITKDMISMGIWYIE